METYKICKICNENKNLKDFYFRKESGKHRLECKKCTSERQKKYRKQNKEQIQERRQKYRKENKEKLNKQSKKYYNDNKDEILAKQKTKYKNLSQKEKKDKYLKKRKLEIKNKERVKKYKREYYKENIEKYRKINKKYYLKNKKAIQLQIKERYHKDENFKLRKNISAIIRRSIKNKKGSYKNYIDFTIKDLRKHLENQFKWWMTWDNWGRYNSFNWNDNDPKTWTWQIDHIIPQSSFNLKNIEEVKKCWSLNNLRPLSAKENLLKSNKII